MRNFQHFNAEGRRLLLFPAFLLVLTDSVFCENPDTALIRIKSNLALIHHASDILDINPHVLSSVIYIERTLNYDWTDDALDVIIASTGQNSSIGFCQVKLKTAYWIEVQLSDSTREFYPGDQYAQILHVSQSPKELIQKLSSDSLNILYAAAYLRIIQSRWSGAGYPIDDRPDIIGTLYSTGLFYPDGTERLPRGDPEANEFGRLVKDALHIFQE